MNIGYKEKKGEGSTVFVPYQNSTLQDASYQILLWTLLILSCYF